MAPQTWAMPQEEKQGHTFSSVPYRVRQDSMRLSSTVKHLARQRKPNTHSRRHNWFTFRKISEALFVSSSQVRQPHTSSPVPLHCLRAICYDFAMRKTALYDFNLLLWAFLFVSVAPAQTATGSLEFTARITPTAARPEPVRQFTFYLLTRSYAEIVKEAEEKDPAPARDAFID